MDAKEINQLLIVDLSIYLLRKYRKSTRNLLKRLRDATKNDHIQLPDIIKL